jgi:hypothetical protein
MRGKAAAGARITAPRDSAADELREGCAARVPTLRAAELIDVADTRTADLILAASCFRVLLEAATGARTSPAIAGDAKGSGSGHAG